MPAKRAEVVESLTTCCSTSACEEINCVLGVVYSVLLQRHLGRGGDNMSSIVYNARKHKPQLTPDC